MDEIWQEMVGYPLSDLQASLEGIFPDLSIHLSELLGQIASGRGKEAAGDVLGEIGRQLLANAGGLKQVLFTILLLGILSALFSNFAGAFANHQIADVSFYFTYLLLMILLLKAFESAFYIAQESLGHLVLFVKLFIPAYLLTVGAAAGAAAAVGYYELIFLVIYGVESLFLNCLLPFICSFAMLSVVNGIWEEGRLGTLTELLQKGLTGALKWSLTLITGAGVLQSMILPVLGSLKMTGIQKAVAAIPGLGGLADGSAQMLLGSAVLLKNSMGVVLFLLLLLICAVPLAKILLVGLLLKLGTAGLGILADKRMTGCADKIADGVFLLFRTLLTAMAYFMILAAVAAFSSNRGF